MTYHAFLRELVKIFPLKNKTKKKQLKVICYERGDTHAEPGVGTFAPDQTTARDERGQPSTTIGRAVGRGVPTCVG